MNRFHQSMSWSSPTESGKQQPEGDQKSPSKFSGSHHSWWADEQDDADSCDGSLGAGMWSGCASGRSFFLPLHYTPSYAYPLVVWLHCNGFNEHQIDTVMPHISVRNYVGVGIRGSRAADTMGHQFDWHDSPASIAAAHEAVCEAVDEAAERFSIHGSRIVLAGYRDGGTMAQRIAFRDPERFAGVISLGGRIPRDRILDLSQLRRRRLPMLWQWGRDNEQYTTENVNADCRLTMSISAKVEIRQYPDDNEMNTVALSDIDDWIMRRIVAESSISDSDRWSSTPVAYSSN